MEKKSTKPKDIFVSEEEKILNWSEVQSSFKKTFGDEIYSSWLKNLLLLKEYNDYIVLGVPTRFFRDWIVSRYLDKILEQIKKFKLSLNRIEFIISEDNKTKNRDEFKGNSLNTVTEIKDSILNYNRLNPNLNFENFIRGTSNEIALSSSKKVCEQTSRYNPLYIYGGVGLGKTHLLNSIAWEIQKENKRKFIYMSAERFMYQFIRSIKFRDTISFKEQFRSVDVLMIDDLQFIGGKDSTQQEFFHLFNDLIDMKKQIIILICFINLIWGQCDDSEVELWNQCYSIDITFELDLSGYELSGPIPDEIFMLYNLMFLDYNI